MDRSASPACNERPLWNELTNPTSMFFPHGIELIYLNVTVSGVTATIKVAGEKGITPSEVASDVMSADPDPA